MKDPLLNAPANFPPLSEAMMVQCFQLAITTHRVTMATTEIIAMKKIQELILLVSEFTELDTSSPAVNRRISKKVSFKV